jgi:hypothetical protein
MANIIPERIDPVSPFGKGGMRGIFLNIQTPLKGGES